MRLLCLCLLWITICEAGGWKCWVHNNFHFTPPDACKHGIRIANQHIRCPKSIHNLNWIICVCIVFGETTCQTKKQANRIRNTNENSALRRLSSRSVFIELGSLTFLQCIQIDSCHFFAFSFFSVCECVDCISSSPIGVETKTMDDSTSKRRHSAVEQKKEHVVVPEVCDDKFDAVCAFTSVNAHV